MNTSQSIEEPYVGLRPFDSHDSMRFFGRREQVAELLERLHDAKFLSVVGSSGCGKSSLVKAGLIPSLLAGFLVGSRDRWKIAAVRPGDDPCENLISALTVAFAQSCSGESDRDLLRTAVSEYQTEVIVDWLKSRLGQHANLLLLVDQFEEVFSFRVGSVDDNHILLSRDQRRELAARRDEAATFVDLLLQLRARSKLPVYSVLTMRSDFLGDCDVFYGLPEAMYESLYLVPRLGREQLRLAIEGPALMSQATIAPRLMDHLLNSLGDRSDRLPILQHLLLRTWQAYHEGSDGRAIDFRHYESAGRFEGALSKDAESAMKGEDENAVSAIFKTPH